MWGLRRVVIFVFSPCLVFAIEVHGNGVRRRIVGFAVDALFTYGSKVIAYRMVVCAGFGVHRFVERFHV